MPPCLRGVTYVAAFLLLVVITQLIAVLSVVLFGGFDFASWAHDQRAHAAASADAVRDRARAAARHLSTRADRTARASCDRRSSSRFAATILAMWLSLGPLPNAGDARVSGFGLYGLLYDYVPGFNGVRVPARYAMIAGLFLADRWPATACSDCSRPSPESPSPESCVAGRLAFLILIEGAAIPMEINRTWNQNEAVPPARVIATVLATAPARLRARRGAACRHRDHRISVRRCGVGDSLRLLRGRALEADHQRLQRQLPAELQGARRAPAAHREGSGSGVAVAERLRLDARRRASKRICESPPTLIRLRAG